MTTINLPGGSKQTSGLLERPYHRCPVSSLYGIGKCAAHLLIGYINLLLYYRVEK